MTVEETITLDRAANVLGWPGREDVLNPTGAGPAVYAALVREKIGRVLARLPDGRDAHVGILTPDHASSETEPPLAIVVEFTSGVSDNTLQELQRLAWNFSHSPTLITIEPHLLRVWTACEAPTPGRLIADALVHTLTPEALNRATPLEFVATRALHWISLVSGDFYASHAERFDRDGRADQMLLGNLRFMRDRLYTEGLVNDDICHDLLARVIFIQFLFDRKDTDGAAALDAAKLARLYKDGTLKHVYGNFSELLKHYDDTYRLFEWLNVRFNGDLFPGKGDTAEARAIGWAAEQRHVRAEHLRLLSDFIGGRIDMPSGQGALWPQYAFDVIPLEFISSIYETFVTERAARDAIFYTPPHLVDFVLDRVLPWRGTVWDLKILDPACGSGIFLVKAFQRLVHRWKQANPGQQVKADTLRRLLERNLFGVDKDPHAVRVACFSLYLAMCDEIEPRHYWTQVVFPTMRDRRLICSDFFAKDGNGFTVGSASYDLIIGNAPWGDGLATKDAKEWAKATEPKWTIANNDIGGLFLAKGSMLLCDGGRLAMIQSANSLLFNDSPPARRFRQETFSRRRITEIYNLSAMRFKVFKRKSHTPKRSTSPACAIIMELGEPSLDDRIAYVSPKSTKPLVDEFAIVIEPQDRRVLTVREAVSDPLIWTTLMWGGPRDRALVRRLQRYATLGSLEAEGVRSSRGIQYGDKRKDVWSLAQHRLFDERNFAAGSLLEFDADRLPLAGPLELDARMSTDFAAFAFPQLIIKRSWRAHSSRFEARLARSSRQEAVVCNQSYVSAHATTDVLEAACLTFNSMLATYFLQLTSGRTAAYRPEALISEIRNMPLPRPDDITLDGADSLADVDDRVFKAFELKDAERVLVEDMFNYVVPDFRGDASSPGMMRTKSTERNGLGFTSLEDYCSYFMRVLKAGFGDDRGVEATIFEIAASGAPLPYRLVAFSLVETHTDTRSINLHRVTNAELIRQMEALDLISEKTRRGLYARRVARVYDGSSGAPKIFVLKPDMARFWTRSMALEDGDAVALDLFRWQQSGASKGLIQ
ncbi:HsdM family class I SAM-dependent methyltransferase [Ochrobactrum quorumnocens]|uniref:HsdM family class I SAM-dependent methyltransferase n=1 Tax=Ochrobactrum quorumnocens TaxID=271865 RepID=UPI001AEE3391|nr:N-6 DNA methylase [[Ochrobactrum] quorumnocens]